MWHDVTTAVIAGFDQIYAAATHFGTNFGRLTADGAFVRLAQIALASVTIANVLALLGALFFVATLLMRTIVPLRIAAIIADIFFVCYAVLASSVGTFFLYVLLLPINVFRLRQIMRLVRKARDAAQGDLSLDWLKPFMSRRAHRSGDLLFRKGDPAGEMLFTVTGKYLVREIGVELPAGRIIGELGFLSPGNRRTQSVECIAPGEVLTISYDKLLEIYFQNPAFGYYFLRLTSERLLQNAARLEAIVERRTLEPDTQVLAWEQARESVRTPIADMSRRARRTTPAPTPAVACHRIVDRAVPSCPTLGQG
ncbi:MAG: cyclic nucleotide-binding domain-containing protein [Hyphomicrobiales bacterium]|nr:cyclic nucleotide-binding domain-containing protein [Hyphomicrobiales bacterium]